MRYLIILLLVIGCAPLRKMAAPDCPDAVEERIRVSIKTHRGEALANVVSDLNIVYGEPTIEVSAFRDESGKYTVMEKLYYKIDDNKFVVVSVVNEKILMIDTVHVPEREIRVR